MKNEGYDFEVKTSSADEALPDNITPDEVVTYLAEIKGDAVEVDENTRLLDDHVIDSLAMISLVSELDDEFDVEISAKDIVPENFATVGAIQNLIDRLEDED